MKMTKQELLAQIANRVTPEEYEPRDIGQGFGYKIDFDYLKEDFDDDIEHDEPRKENRYQKLMKKVIRAGVKT